MQPVRQSLYQQPKVHKDPTHLLLHTHCVVDVMDPGDLQESCLVDSIQTLRFTVRC